MLLNYKSSKTFSVFIQDDELDIVKRGSRTHRNPREYEEDEQFEMADPLPFRPLDFKTINPKPAEATQNADFVPLWEMPRDD